jgi:hypothetical protein
VDGFKIINKLLDFKTTIIMKLTHVLSLASEYEFITPCIFNIVYGMINSTDIEMERRKSKPFPSSCFGGRAFPGLFVFFTLIFPSCHLGELHASSLEDVRAKIEHS